MSKSNQSQILKVIITTTLIGVGIALAGSDGGVSVGRIPLFALCTFLAFMINWLVFIPAAIVQTEKFFDLTGGITFITITLVALILNPAQGTHGLIVATLVVIWATRLASFLFFRIKKDGKDGRFDQIKSNPLRFFMTWTLQGLWVSLTSAAALAVLTSSDTRPIGVMAILGLLVWIAGFSIEIIADRQKSIFKSQPKNKGRFITTGLWSWSRHPNYFGEITLWIGVAIIAFPVLQGWQYITLISPIFVILLLTKVSGIPLLAKRAQDRWGKDKDFQDYIERTSTLIPLPPKS